MRNNKGITLIALVVTIIILLILAGVSITTLSGNGLFGRAESSAAKYQQASENENSTLSSLMDKYDHYESQTTEMVTVKWTMHIAERGSFINNSSPAEYVNSNYADKQVVAIKPDGTKQLINPYQTADVQLPKGTKLRFYYYRDKTKDYTVFMASEIDAISKAYETHMRIRQESDEADGKLMYAELTLDTNLKVTDGMDEEGTVDDEDAPEQYKNKSYSGWNIVYQTYTDIEPIYR